MASADSQIASGRGSAQGPATETTPLVQPRLTITKVLSGQTGEDRADEDFVDVPAMEVQAGDVEIVAGTPSRDHRHSSIFKESIEKHIRAVDPGMMQWLTSLNGVALQAILCTTLIIIQAESSVWTEIARKWKPAGADPKVYKSFNSAALGVGVSIASVLICFIVAAVNKEFHLLFNKETVWKLLKYATPGCGFQVTQWLNLMALGFLSADVAKVLDQGRLLVTALITFKVFGRNQSTAGWNSLLVVSLSAVSYAEMKNSLGKLAGSQEETAQLSELLGKVLAGTTVATTTDAPGASSTYSNTYLLGLLIVLFSVVAQSGLCVLCEKVMKEDKGMAFYVQKFYLEVPGVIMGLFLTNIGNPFLYRVLKYDMHASNKILGMVGGEGKMFEYFANPFQGWNLIVFWAFVLLLLKSWLSGLMVKQLNAIVKQLCSVFGVGITYFLMKVHICPGGKYFCPENLASVEFPMVIIDFTVLFSVLAYTLAGRDKQRKDMFKKELQSAKDAAQSQV